MNVSDNIYFSQRRMGLLLALPMLNVFGLLVIPL